MLWSMVCSILAFFTSITEAFPAAAPVRPAKGVVSVSSLEVETEGSGCRPGEVSVTLSSDNSVITLILDNFAAADGPQAGTTGSRAFCRINVGMNMPGWAFDISSADFRGYVSLDKGVNASLVSRWKWIDKSGVDLKGKGNIQKKITGPFNDDFLLHKDGELSDTEASACQKKDARIQISLSGTVTAQSGASGSGLIRADSLDAGFGEILNLSWKKC